MVIFIEFYNVLGIGLVRNFMFCLDLTLCKISIEEVDGFYLIEKGFQMVL